MESTSGYRKLAAECLQVAERLPNPADRARMLRMAQEWLEIAQLAEQKDVAARPA
jgi:hypothetical protein